MKSHQGRRRFRSLRDVRRRDRKFWRVKNRKSAREITAMQDEMIIEELMSGKRDVSLCGADVDARLLEVCQRLSGGEEKPLPQEGPPLVPTERCGRLTTITLKAPWRLSR